MVQQRRRFLHKPPELKDKKLQEFLFRFQDEITAMFADADGKVPPQKVVDVTLKSRGDFKEITVPHSLGTSPNSYIVLDPPRGGYTFRKSRETIGSDESAYFESDAPAGKTFVVRLEAR